MIASPSRATSKGFSASSPWDGKGTSGNCRRSGPSGAAAANGKAAKRGTACRRGSGAVLCFRLPTLSSARWGPAVPPRPPTPRGRLTTVRGPTTTRMIDVDGGVADWPFPRLRRSRQPSPSAGLLVARFKIDGYKKVAGQCKGSSGRGSPTENVAGQISISACPWAGPAVSDPVKGRLCGHLGPASRRQESDDLVMQVVAPTRDDVDDDQAHSLVEIGSTLDRECPTLFGPVLVAGTDQFDGRDQGESGHRREEADLESIREDGRHHMGRCRGGPCRGESHGRAGGLDPRGAVESSKVATSISRWLPE